MSVLCCRVPDFLYKFACRNQKALNEHPVALLGPDDCIWAMSPQAAYCGVKRLMRTRQAQAHCPDLAFQALNLTDSQAEQQIFIQELAKLDLPTEEVDWGLAYLDLHTVATQKQDVHKIAGELGRRLRLKLGNDLEPAIGWDSGKFTAQAAAVHTIPGRMRLVDATDEKRFLAPLPITLLPLPQAALQQLYWLGIRTLGQFGDLPAGAVWQRFGRAGKEAQQWARGQDKRPVRHTVNTTPDLFSLEFDPPITQLPFVVARLNYVLQPYLLKLTDHLQGCCGLHMTLTFEDRSTRATQVHLVEPTTSIQRLNIEIEKQINAVVWPDALTQIVLTMTIAELPLQQMTLFTEDTRNMLALEQLAKRLVRRHGSIFFQSIVGDATHPIPERRTKQMALV